jgi:hypothetical protein
LEVWTESRCYRIQCCGQGQALISGHPFFCPEPVLVKVHGSTWGGTVMRSAFIGRGMRMEFLHPEHQTVTTSPVVEIKETSTS